jgi:hypothetical protein
LAEGIGPSKVWILTQTSSLQLEVGRTQLTEKSLEGQAGGRVDTLPQESLKGSSIGGPKAVSQSCQSLFPSAGLKVPSLLRSKVRLIHPLKRKTVVGESSLVRKPLLIDLLMEPRKDPKDGRSPGVDPKVGSQPIREVHRVSRSKLPRTRHKGIGLGSKGTHRTKVDHVSRDL